MIQVNVHLTTILPGPFSAMLPGDGEGAGINFA